MLVEACSCKADRRGCKAEPMNVYASTNRCRECGHLSVVDGVCIRRSCPVGRTARREGRLAYA